MLSSKLAIFLLIVSLVVISGCVTGGGDNVKKASKGLVISSWKPDFETVSPGQPVEFELSLTNLGQVDAEIGKIFFEGIDAKKWSVQTAECDKLKSKTILPQGNEKCIVKAAAPDAPSGFRLSADPKVSVIYSYSTEAVKSLNIRSLDEAKRLFAESGQAIQVSDVKAQTDSPIEFDITTKTPITVFKNGLATPVLMRIRNTGGGIVCSGNCEPKNIDKVGYTLSVVGEGVVLADTGCRPGIIDLINDANTIPCTKISLDKPEFENYPLIKFVAEYKYKTQAATSVTVDNSGQI